MVTGTQLRTVAQVIQLIVLPKVTCIQQFRILIFKFKGLSIPMVQTQLDDEGNLNGDRAESIKKNLDLTLTELNFVGNALLAAK